MTATSAATEDGLTVDVTVEPGTGLTRLVLAGELDVSTAPVVDRALRRAEATGSRVEVDLTALAFADCRGAQPLVAAALRSRGAVTLRHPRPLVAHVLAHLGLPADPPPQGPAASVATAPCPDRAYPDRTCPDRGRPPRAAILRVST